MFLLNTTQLYQLLLVNGIRMKQLKAVPACYTNIQLNAGYISLKLLMTLY